MQSSHSQSSQISPASYPIIARAVFLGQLHIRFILHQLFFQNKILVLHPLLCKVPYETSSQSTENTPLTTLSKEMFSRSSKMSTMCTAHRGVDHTSTVMSIQQASYSLQIHVLYLVLNYMYQDCKVHVVVPKYISNSSAK